MLVKIPRQAHVDTYTGRQVKWVRSSNDWVYGELSQDLPPRLT